MSVHGSVWSPLKGVYSGYLSRLILGVLPVLMRIKRLHEHLLVSLPHKRLLNVLALDLLCRQGLPLAVQFHIFLVC